MNEELEPDGLPNEEQSLAISKLNDSDLKQIDEALLAEACDKWRKTARIVGFAMMRVRLPGVPDVFFSNRVKKLVKEGKLLVVGDLNYMGRSEVKINRQ